MVEMMQTVWRLHLHLWAETLLHRLLSLPAQRQKPAADSAFLAALTQHLLLQLEAQLLHQPIYVRV